MPQLVPVSLTAGPNTLVFKPYETDANGVSILSHSSSGIRSHDDRFTISSRTSDGMHRVSIRLMRPRVVVDSQTGLNVVHDKSFGMVEFRFPPDGTPEDRTQMVQLLISSLSDPTVKSVVEDLERIW